MRIQTFVKKKYIDIFEETKQQTSDSDRKLAADLIAEALLLRRTDAEIEREIEKKKAELKKLEKTRDDGMIARLQKAKGLVERGQLSSRLCGECTSPVVSVCPRCRKVYGEEVTRQIFVKKYGDRKTFDKNVDRLTESNDKYRKKIQELKKERDKWKKRATTGTTGDKGVFI